MRSGFGVGSPARPVKDYLFGSAGCNARVPGCLKEGGKVRVGLSLSQLTSGILPETLAKKGNAIELTKENKALHLRIFRQRKAAIW